MPTEKINLRKSEKCAGLSFPTCPWKSDLGGDSETSLHKTFGDDRKGGRAGPSLTGDRPVDDVGSGSVRGKKSRGRTTPPVLKEVKRLPSGLSNSLNRFRCVSLRATEVFVYCRSGWASDVSGHHHRSCGPSVRDNVLPTTLNRLPSGPPSGSVAPERRSGGWSYVLVYGGEAPESVHVRQK